MSHVETSEHRTFSLQDSFKKDNGTFLQFRNEFFELLITIRIFQKSKSDSKRNIKRNKLVYN